MGEPPLAPPILSSPDEVNVELSPSTVTVPCALSMNPAATKLVDTAPPFWMLNSP